MKKVLLAVLVMLLLSVTLAGAAFADTSTDSTIYYVDGKVVDKITFEKALYEWQFAVPHYDIIFNVANK